ncbi:MAG TPA: hypothetical protein DD723_01100 [Candidatus Omnitrophica bacterium]|nr:MAG: hypothetical protein A2Z81_02325 [Omnitrophica WOR_2 bacterium GWA2_45_18]OGX19421.1 MAG: hypothetical protein A2Y04_04335 [Omnitrophica WOR_2 bacterium GWC2_45_7]HBR14127.1 hypothetical protein [Candidatus Omnitrophota bacterium]
MGNLFAATRIFFISFLLVFSLCCAGCDKLYSLLDKEGAEEKELIGEIVPYEKNPTVEEIQTLLKLYGYNPGKIDGVLGLRTRNAIAQFQKDNNLKQTRFADQETWGKLKVFKDSGLIVENQVNVQLVQKILKNAGFNPGTVDGNLGPQTLAAIKAFQKAHALEADGKIGFKTLTKLADYFE